MDAAGNRTRLTFPSAAGGLVVTDTYDSLNRLTGVYQGAANAASRVVGYGYDILGRRSTASFAAATTPVASTAIGYTNADLESSITHSWNGASIGFGYGYNADRQKTSVSATDSQFLPSGLTASAKSYTSNNLNQYTTISSTALTYDKRGNLLTDGTWTYGYDTENRLVSASKSGLSVTYGYDALGRRLSRKVTSGTTSPTSPTSTTYAWLSVGDQEWAEFSGTSSLGFAGATVYGAGLDEPVAGISPANARSYYFQDALGSVIALANASGQLTEKHAYTAFGLETTVGANAAPYRFAGRRVDPETGLSYNRARTYAPALGRFLQADPAGTDGGLNLYAYASNDPANITDPSGKWGAIAGIAQSFGSRALPYLGGAATAGIYIFTPTTPGMGTTNSPSCGNVGCLANSSNTNPYKGPVSNPVIVVDKYGNGIPVGPGEKINSSPDGKFQQVQGADGEPNGVRIDFGGHPKQKDPLAQGPHGHRPGITTPTGNPHLPVYR